MYLRKKGPWSKKFENHWSKGCPPYSVTNFARSSGTKQFCELVENIPLTFLTDFLPPATTAQT